MTEYHSPDGPEGDFLQEDLEIQLMISEMAEQRFRSKVIGMTAVTGILLISLVVLRSLILTIASLPAIIIMLTLRAKWQRLANYWAEQRKFWELIDQIGEI